MVNNYITGWWFFATPLKNDGVSSSVGMMTWLSTKVVMGFIDQLSYAEYIANQPDTLQKGNSSLVNVDNPIDTKRLKDKSTHPRLT